MGFEQGAAQLLERGTIEIAPLAYMRGRTLNHSFIILDEAQNTTPEQMKMFLTRIGFGTKAVVTGDVTQIDLARGQKSGLVEARRILAGVRGIAFTQFGARGRRAPSAGGSASSNAYEATQRERGEPRAATAWGCAPGGASSSRPVRARRSGLPARSSIARWRARGAAPPARPDHGALRGRGRGPAPEPRLPRTRLRDQRAHLRLRRARRSAATSCCARRWSRARRASRARRCARITRTSSVHGVLHLPATTTSAPARRARMEARGTADPARGSGSAIPTRAEQRQGSAVRYPHDRPRTKPTPPRAPRRAHAARARGPRAADRSCCARPTSATSSTPTRSR